MTNPQFPGQSGPQAPSEGAYGPPGPASQQWSPGEGFQTQSIPQPGAPQPGAPQPGGPQQGAPQPGPYPPSGFAPMPPARQSVISRLPMPILLALGSAVAGVITFFMGFLGWISVSEDIERQSDKWAADLNGTLDVPAYLSPSLILSPGWFFLTLGTVAVASAGLIAPRWRGFLPYLAFISVFGWLGLLVCAVALPPFVGLGAGAYIGLIVGFGQAALLVVAAVLEGMQQPAGPPPGGPGAPVGPMGPRPGV